MLPLLTFVPAPADGAVPGKDFTATACEARSDSVARLYAAGLGRTPDEGGFEFWLSEYEQGRRHLLTMAEFFVSSPEFVESYGRLSNSEFVRQMYRNVLDREGDAGGIDFWTGRLDAGMSRARLMLRFAESPENVTRSGTVAPEFGFYNEGLARPWTCDRSAPPTRDLDCDDFDTWADVQAFYQELLPTLGDAHNLDGNNDGIACNAMRDGGASAPAAATPITTTTTTGPQCDPNYSGCVPVASDVDCAGGSGNGPAYVEGPIRVIGRDIYGLDRDKDGIACE